PRLILLHQLLLSSRLHWQLYLSPPGKMMTELKKYFSRPEPRNSIINLLTGRKTVQRLVEIAGGKGKGEDDQVANTESEEKEGQQ
ncbi:MAG: hypothetical protein R6T78_00175, partial [Dehalococcoidales bacterium]